MPRNPEEREVDDLLFIVCKLNLVEFFIIETLLIYAVLNSIWAFHGVIGLAWFSFHLFLLFNVQSAQRIVLSESFLWFYKLVSELIKASVFILGFFHACKLLLDFDDEALIFFLGH